MDLLGCRPDEGDARVRLEAVAQRRHGSAWVVAIQDHIDGGRDAGVERAEVRPDTHDFAGAGRKEGSHTGLDAKENVVHSGVGRGADEYLER